MACLCVYVLKERDGRDQRAVWSEEETREKGERGMERIFRVVADKWEKAWWARSFALESLNGNDSYLC